MRPAAPSPRLRIPRDEACAVALHSAAKGSDARLSRGPCQRDRVTTGLSCDKARPGSCQARPRSTGDPAHSAQPTDENQADFWADVKEVAALAM